MPLQILTSCQRSDCEIVCEIVCNTLSAQVHDHSPIPESSLTGKCDAVYLTDKSMSKLSHAERQLIKEHQEVYIRMAEL